MNRLSRKPRLFKSFTGLSVKQFDDIYKEIESKYERYEIKRLSYKRNRERDIGGGKRFKTPCERQSYHGFSILPSIHHLHANGISLRSRPE